MFKLFSPLAASVLLHRGGFFFFAALSHPFAQAVTRNTGACAKLKRREVCCVRQLIRLFGAYAQFFRCFVYTHCEPLHSFRHLLRLLSLLGMKDAPNCAGCFVQNNHLRAELLRCRYPAAALRLVVVSVRAVLFTRPPIQRADNFFHAFLLSFDSPQ